MKLATRINSYFRDGDKNLDRVFAEFQSVGLTHVDLNYPEHCTGVTVSYTHLTLPTKRIV